MATFTNDAKLASCIEVGEVEVENFNDLIFKKFGYKCEFIPETAYKGFFFKCGKNNNQLIFHKKEWCEKFGKTLSGEMKPMDILDYAPSIKNKGGYLVSLNSCFDSSVKNKNLPGKSKTITKDFDRCNCAALEMGNYLDSEITKTITRNIF